LVRSDSKIDKNWEKKLRENGEKRSWERERIKKRRRKVTGGPVYWGYIIPNSKNFVLEN